MNLDQKTVEHTLSLHLILEELHLSSVLMYLVCFIVPVYDRKFVFSLLIGPAHIISISGPQTVSSGSSVDISVVAGGTPTGLTYQWRRNGIVISGETGSTLTIQNISNSDIGVYNCTPSNSRGIANSATTTISVTSKYMSPLYFN